MPLGNSCRGDCGADAGAGVAVAVGICGAGHGFVAGGVVEQGGDFVYDFIEIGADEPHGSGFEGLGTLGGVAHHEYGLSKAGGFLLDASAVGQYYMGLFHQEDEGQIFERFDEEHVAESVEVFSENFVDGFADVGVEVHGIDEIDLGIFFGQRLYGPAHGDETVAKVLAAVSGDEHESATVGAPRVVSGFGELPGQCQTEFGCGADFVGDHVEGVDYGVSRDGDFVGGDAFGQEIGAAQGGGGEVEGGEASGNLPVHFLGPWGIDVVGAQTCFDMADGNLPVEGGEGRGSGCCGVAVDKDDVGARLGKHIAHAGQHTGCDVVKVLPLSHDIEVVVGTDVENFQNLVEHLAVLAGDADECAE